MADDTTKISGQLVLPGHQNELGYLALDPRLSPKQELFCQEMGLNGADPVLALQIAYPSTSKKSAQANAYRLLRTNKIQQRIAELKAELQRRYAVEAQNVVQLLSMTMNLDRRSFVDLETGKALALHQLTPEAASIVDVEFTTDRFGVTHAQPVVTPRLKAAETLCKIMGLADRVEIGGFKFTDYPYQIRQIPTKPVQTPYNQHITRSQSFQAIQQFGPFRIFTAGVFLIYLLAPRSFKRIKLQMKVLLRSRNTSISNFHIIFPFVYQR